MFQKKKFLWMLHVFWLFFVLCLAACDQPPPEPIKIGLSINLSGRGGAAGEHIRDGAMLAVQEVNDSGGINGRPLALLVRDDENSEAAIKKVDQSLIDEGVVAIFGHSYSSNTIIAYPLVTSQNILLITAYAATNKLTGKDDLFLRTSVDCTLYAKKTAALFDTKDVRAVSVLMDMSNPGFVLDYVDSLKKFFDGSIVEIGFTSRENADWQQIITDLLAPVPDAVLLLTEASMTGVAAQKLRSSGFEDALVGSVWTQTPSLFDYAGEAVENMSVVTFINPDNRAPAYLQFADRIKEKFNRPATARSTRAYEMIMILADALSRCEEITALDLKKALLAREYETLMGHVAFDANGDVVRPVYEVKVSDGRFCNGGEL